MNGTEFKAMLERLGIKQVDLARFLVTRGVYDDIQVAQSTISRWNTIGVPPFVELFLEACVANDWRPWEDLKASTTKGVKK